MLKIGLTGGIASGKSTICQLFSDLNIPIIDADIIARELVEPEQPALKEIVAFFGVEVLNSDGSLNRRFLRNIIFSDLKAKSQLEAILHPKISDQLEQQSNSLHSSYCILAIPLLIESNLQKNVDRIVVIDISVQQQIERLCHRDNISVHDAQLIIDNQCSREQRITFADDIITNGGTLDNLHKIIFDLDQKYRKLAYSSTIACQHTDSHGQ